MRKRSFWSVFAIGGLVLAQQPNVPAEGPRQPVPVVPPLPEARPATTEPGTAAATPGGLGALELAQAMTASMRLATPGEPHQQLARLAGKYDVAMTLVPPGLAAQQCDGTATAASVLGGRYLIVNCVVRVQGARLEGIYIFGFDNLHGLYTASWRDSMSTWSVECSGPPNLEHPERIDMPGTMVDAASPTGRPFTLQVQWTDAGFEVAVRDSIGDQQVEVMRQRFVRAAAPAAAAPDPKAPGDERGK